MLTTKIDESTTSPGSAITLKKGLPTCAKAQLLEFTMNQGIACAKRHGVLSFKITPKNAYPRGFKLTVNLNGFTFDDTTSPYEIFLSVASSSYESRVTATRASASALAF